MSIPKEVEQALTDFQQQRVWGQIQIDFQHGQIVVIRKQVTIKPEEDNREHPYQR